MGARRKLELAVENKVMAGWPGKVLAALFSVMLALMVIVPSKALADDGYNYIRTYEEFQSQYDGEINWNVVANAMDDVINAARDYYAAGDDKAAYKAINDAYYGYYETTGFERIAMGYIGNGRKAEVELLFSNAKSIAKKQGSAAEFNEACDKLSEALHTDADKLDGTSGSGGGTASGVATFAACFGILLREGIEAILVLGAIIAYLVKSGARKYLKQVYIGAVLGVVVSFIAAWALDALKLANAAPQEIIEGVTALVAVVVLYWVSNWMLSKSESKAWNRYIEGKVAASISTGSVFALAFTAWLAVFREGAEVILFYQPMLAGGDMAMVWGGFFAAVAALAVIFVLMRVYSVKLPLKPFFLAMSILMFVMSISFLGGGIKELIEGDVITMTPIPWIPSNEILEIFGIFPCVETIVPQLILIAITIVIFVWHFRKNKKGDDLDGADGDGQGGSPAEGEGAPLAAEAAQASEGSTATA